MHSFALILNSSELTLTFVEATADRDVFHRKENFLMVTMIL